MGLITKICTKCKIKKPIEEFYKRKISKDGFRNDCKSCLMKQHKLYTNKHKKKIALWHRNYYLKNKNEASKKSKKYYLNNKKQIKIKHRNYERNRRHTDINYKILNNLRKRLYKALKGICKSKHTIKLLGCSIEKLKHHLEKQFTKGMNWKNYGKWEIDHIKPCSKFNLKEISEQNKCFHYTNLQPLWAKDNHKKHNNYE